MAHGIVERLTAFVTLDRRPERELENARQRASAGDPCWAEWLRDLATGRAIIASMDLVIEVRLTESSRRFHAARTALWLEPSAHPPLVESQVQEAAIDVLPDLEASLSGSIDAATAQLTDMCVHVDLSQTLCERLKETPASASCS